ncbi:MAG: TSUP family transporter [Armatimonadetes bacterium]|nr:TSUP family transporter [Armatimonadota bacterium]
MSYAGAALRPQPMHVLAYILILMTGVTFGLIGAGGAIIVVPILVYMLGKTFDEATGYALPISVLVSGVGTVIAAKHRSIDFKKALEFGIPTAIISFLSRKFILPALPEMMFGLPRKSAMMFAFALLLVGAGVTMIRSKKIQPPENPHPMAGLGFGALIGVFSGVFGIGGGFIIVPTLTLFFGLEMKNAVGTTLCSVVMITSCAFTAQYLNHPNMPWGFIAGIMAMAATGMVIGSHLRQRIDGSKLKVGFGYFVLSLAFVVPILEIIRLRRG